MSKHEHVRLTLFVFGVCARAKEKNNGQMREHVLTPITSAATHTELLQRLVSFDGERNDPAVYAGTQSARVLWPSVGRSVRRRACLSLGRAHGPTRKRTALSVLCFQYLDNESERLLALRDAMVHHQVRASPRVVVPARFPGRPPPADTHAHRIVCGRPARR